METSIAWMRIEELTLQGPAHREFYGQFTVPWS